MRPSQAQMAAVGSASRPGAGLWNAAQRELVTTGIIHNYLRMLWGKKVLEWSPSPAEAYRTLEHLNNKYALDGRDPNSISGIFWVLGRYDRPWGPERPIFGKVRYMSSRNTAKKVRVKEYIKRFESSGYKPTKELVDLYGKISYPFINFVIILIGIPFALRHTRGGTLMYIGMGMGIGFIFYGFMAINTALGKAGVLPPFLSAWLPNIIFCICGFFMLAKLNK